MMVLNLFKRSSPASAKSLLRQQAANLLIQANRAARNPAMFGPGRVDDDLEGRFDALTLVACLISLRLSGLGEQAQPLNQAFVNSVFKSFDDGLREDGVGDLTVPKKMQRLAESFYGRVGAYRSAFEKIDANDAEGLPALENAIWRNVLKGQKDKLGFAGALAKHSLALRAMLASLPIEAFSGGDVQWPHFSALDEGD